MLYALSVYLSENVWGALRLFQYLSMRAICAALTALIVSLFLGPKLIERLRSLSVGQYVRDDGPKTHLSKAGTPTMGGLLIILAISLTTLLWADLRNPDVWIVLAVLIGFGVVGFIDDYRKVVKKQSMGLKAKEKYGYLSIGGILVAVILYVMAATPQETALLIPYFKNLALPLGLLFIPFVYFFVVGFSNAVNLTDGLDGLAIMPTVMVASGLAIFSYAAGHSQFASYLNIPYIAGAGELTIICASLFGAGLGFLWFNTYPAQVFMGDIGALALGGTLATIAVLIRQEVALCIMGGIFIIEMFSVIIQVASYKTFKKRVFRMAPIHHHFELKGWKEPKIIVRFWIVTLVLVLIALASLKIR